MAAVHCVRCKFGPIVCVGGGGYGPIVCVVKLLLIHDGLHGWAGSFCTEQNHTAKPKLSAKYLSF